MLMKFDPDTNCVPHTHVGVTKTLVLEGEHRIYRPGPDGALGPPDIRPAGTFSENRGDETHVEGGGPEGAIILLSMQAVEGDVYDVLREDLTLDRKITLDNFARGLERQRGEDRLRARCSGKKTLPKRFSSEADPRCCALPKRSCCSCSTTATGVSCLSRNRR